jgi:hypothetical protein
MGAARSRQDADDRLPVDPPGRIEGGDGAVERRNLADVRPQPSVPDPLDDLTQLRAIGQDNKVDRQPSAGRASVGRRWSPVFLRPGSRLRTVSRCRRR